MKNIKCSNFMEQVKLPHHTKAWFGKGIGNTLSFIYNQLMLLTKKVMLFQVLQQINTLMGVEGLEPPTFAL